jgi:uncharacterized OsmC-like protein
MAEIRSLLERNVRAVTRRPGVGQGTAVTTARLGESLTCEIRDGEWTIASGMSEKYGGDGSAPNPGVLGRAALASCLAAGYAMWAARRGIPIDELVVAIEADYDVRGELGVDDSVTPAYGAVRAKVSVRSPAPAAEVEAMLEHADRHSSWLRIFTDPVPIEVDHTISSEARAVSTEVGSTAGGASEGAS